MLEKQSDKMPIKTLVVSHKIVERRMDSASGGVLGALLETFMKEDGYYCVPVYDEHLHLKYALSNDSEKIVDAVDDCITEPLLTDEPERIKALLDTGERVLFAGLPCHCKTIVEALGKDYPSFIVIEMICGGVSEDVLVDKYAEEIGAQYGDKVKAIRFRDKEFSYPLSKRITLTKGKTVYHYDKEPFDTLVINKACLNKQCAGCSLCKKDNGLSDLSVGFYDSTYKVGDHLGYSSVVINTEKGRTLFEQSKRRLNIYKEDADINETLIYRKPSKTASLNGDDLSLLSLIECAKKIGGGNSKANKVKQFAALLYKIKSVTRLHPSPLFKFIKLNFFRKNTKTDFWNMGYIFVAPYSEFNLAKNAVIELHGSLYVGTAKRVPSSQLETRLWMREGSKLIVRKQCIFAFGGDVEIFKDAVLDVGDLVTANPFTIICGEKIEIGTPVNIAKGTEVRDTNSHLLSVSGFKLNRPITIGNHVWIASNCNIMPGSKIGDGCVVAGVSYLNKKIPNFSIAEGHPAEVKSEIKYFRM